MKQQVGAKVYWKDALRQAQTKLDDEAVTVQNQRWASAFRQAETDLTSPASVVWLPDEVADVIHRHSSADPSRSSARQPSRWAWLFLLPLLFAPLLISTLLAYRRIVNLIR